VVIDDDERTVTADEMAHWAGGIADRLSDVPPGAIVAILADLRAAAIAASFGGMWAGASITLLDPAEPIAHLDDLVRRIRPTHVIDATGTVGRTWLGLEVIDATTVAPALPEPVAVHPDSIRQIVFTSGSTGRPKAIARHAGAANEAYDVWLRDAANITASSALLLPIQFTGGFGPAVSGTSIGRRSLLVDPRTTPPERIADLVDAGAYEALRLTPSLIRVLGRALGRRRMESVNKIWATGESSDWLDIDLARSITSPNMVYRSVYGASEAAIAIARLEVLPDEPIGKGRVRLGPISNPEMVRLDPVEGDDGVFEIVVRKRVIDGYWDDPELTRQRFGVDADGVRFWRSGDLVSIDDRGMLHLRGRVDDMIKVNGRLVEPAEAERVIRSVGGVRAAVVVPRRVRSGRQQLVGHVEADPETSPSDVRDALRAALPTTIAPTLLVRHDHLPLTSRGKVDRNSLRAGPVVPWRESEATPTATDFEAKILSIIEQCLDVNGLSPTDDVWSVGCDSLGAVEIATQISDQFELGVQPNDVIVASTARSLAALIDTARPTLHGALPIANASGTLPPLHLVCGGGGPAVQYHALALALGCDQPVVFHEQAGLHRRWEFDRTVEHAARRHVDVIMDRWPTGTVVLAGHSYGGVVANTMATMLTDRGRSVRLLLLDAGLGGSGPSALRPTWHGTRAQQYQQWIRWRLMRSRGWFRAVVSRPDSVQRYKGMGIVASWQVVTHRPVPFAGPVTSISAAERSTPLTWPTSNDVTSVVAQGDHLSMLRPPHVAGLADIIRGVLGSP